VSSKFLQPADGIIVTHKSGRGTLLSEEVLEIGRQRIAAGEDPEEVALDLAVYEVSLLAGVEDGELRTAAAADSRETEVHDAADAHSEAIQVAIEFAFARGRQAIDHSALKAATTRTAAAAAVRNAVGAVQRALEKTLPVQLKKAFEAGGRAAVVRLQNLRTAAEADDILSFAFDAENRRAIEWLTQYGTDLIKGLTETTKQDIIWALTAAFEKGNAGSAYDDILQAVGDADRADLITKTEAMRAANGGQREAWNQAVDKGLLTGEERRTWIATELGACEECEAMDGKTASLGGLYVGGIDGPPLHPRCRCTEGLIG
jgi:hypothetical protein